MEKILIQTTDNLKLCAVWSRHASATCVLMAHGIRDNKDEKGNFKMLADKLDILNVDNLRFDFRGHGESEGEFVDMTISKEVQDLESVLKFVESMNYKQIILLGASFGGCISSYIDYEKYPKVKALILWYPALVLGEVNLLTQEEIDEGMEKGWVNVWNFSKTKLFKFGKSLIREIEEDNSYDLMAKIKLPKIFIHGSTDENVPVKTIINVAKDSPNSELVIIDGAVHCFSQTDKSYNEKGLEETVKFIKRFI